MNKTCEICGILSEETTETDLGLMCPACVQDHFNCDSCGDLFLHDCLMGHQEYNYCETCFDDLIDFCESCAENCRRTELDQDGHCSECRAGGNPNIREWDYQPRYKFYGKGPLYFGIELEIEFRGQNSDILIDAADHPYFFLKHDGSIHDGAEVVSHPASFKWINDNFQETWERVLDVRAKGMRSFKTETCGIHIHMSKKAFSKFHLYKFLRFFRENVDFITKVSQRAEENLNQWSSLDSNENILAQAKQGNTGERYVAVNLRPNKTVEIRIFRGNLLETAFHKNLEFCKALFDFTAKSSCSSLTAVHFYKFVSKNKKQFPNLLVFLLKLEITKMKRTPTANGIHRKFPSERDSADGWLIDTENDSQEWVREAVPEEVEVFAVPQEQSDPPERPAVQEEPTDSGRGGRYGNYHTPLSQRDGISEFTSAISACLYCGDTDIDDIDSD